MQTVGELDASGAVIGDIDMRGPSLDDVFLPQIGSNKGGRRWTDQRCWTNLHK
ncbi:hypothetical protein OHU34_41245 [Streptomyces sp. NBC_00080]|uniref:hypothetical protein n=1 Tax=Streptomyces sp. NBC_00080 TaxID=2975645 RepID=UPI00324FD5FF